MNKDATRETTGLPKKLIFWTLFCIVLVAVMYWQVFWLTDTLNLPPAIPTLSAMFLGLVTILAWGFWLLFFAKRRLTGLLVLLIPTVFFTLYYPNFKGSADFTDFKPRFWGRDADFVEASKTAIVDVATTGSLDFPQFLGPNRDAKLDSVELSDSWETPPRQVWKIDIGDGWSGFAAVNGYAITQEQRGAEECVTCYEIKSGLLKWIYSQTRRHEDTMAMGKAGPRATPTIHEGRVYVTSATGVLDCLDGSNGELIWSANVPELVGIKQVEKTNSMGLAYTEEDSTMAWGRAASPLISGNLVIVPAGGVIAKDSNPPKLGKSSATMIAFDKHTGDEKWRGGKRMVAYGSPRLASIGGTNQILLTTEKDSVGHDVETGEELWSHEWLGESNGAANCSQVTVVDDGLLILSKGYSQGAELISVTKNADGKWTTESKQRDPRLLKTKLTNPVIFDGHAYSLSDGFLECNEAKTFERKWKQRGRFGNGQILLVGDKLLLHSESGTLYLVAADPEGYQQLGKMKTIQGICWNTLCLYGDRLLVRSELEAACYQLPLTNPIADNQPSVSDESKPGEDQSETGESE